MADDDAAVLAAVLAWFHAVPRHLGHLPHSAATVDHAVLAVHDSELNYLIIPPLFSLVSFSTTFHICFPCYPLFYVRFFGSPCILINIFLILIPSPAFAADCIQKRKQMNTI